MWKMKENNTWVKLMSCCFRQLAKWVRRGSNCEMKKYKYEFKVSLEYAGSIPGKYFPKHIYQKLAM